jgi:hypothetical protein
MAAEGCSPSGEQLHRLPMAEAPLVSMSLAFMRLVSAGCASAKFVRIERTCENDGAMRSIAARSFRCSPMQPRERRALSFPSVMLRVHATRVWIENFVAKYSFSLDSSTRENYTFVSCFMQLKATSM